MFRALLLAAVFTAAPAAADQLTVPGLTPKAMPQDAAHCFTTGDANNCARTLACIGTDGLWFDGQARGWGEGIITGKLSDGTPCKGRWKYRERVNIASAYLSCEDGTKGTAIFHAQDSLTGTGIGRGMDNRGRVVRIWSGQNVTRFLTPEGQLVVHLPCGDTPIPIS